MTRFSAEKIYALFDIPANKKIISEISANNAKVILFPAIEPALVSNFQTREILNNLIEFDWLIFQDVYTVEFFLQELEKLTVDLFDLDQLRVCACGESVADRLRFVQLHADVIPHSIKPAEIFPALKEYISDENFENLKFLILREISNDSKLKNLLKLNNANVTELAIYETKILENDNLTKLKTLLKGGAVDEFIFNTPFDVLNLAHLFPNENLEKILNGISLFSIDAAAAQSLKEFRLI